MIKSMVAGTAMLALVAGAAHAQSSASETMTSTQTTVAPAAGSYSASQSQKTIDANGVETESNRSHTGGPGGTTDSANARVTAPDGSKLTTSHKERMATLTDITTKTQTSTTSTAQ